MKHLAVLEGALLVVTEKVGRAKLHYLDPVPIREIVERWISSTPSRHRGDGRPARTRIDHRLRRPRR